MDDANGRLILTCANLTAGSTFDFSKIIYSDGEATPVTYRLNGVYTSAVGPTGDWATDAGKYWIISNEVTISLTNLDYQGIFLLQGFASPTYGTGINIVVDKVSAEVGWNVKGGTLSAGAVTGLTMTFE